MRKHPDSSTIAGTIFFIILFLIAVLQIVLICLRATAQITWHWALVFLPLIITGGCFLILTLAAMMLVLFGVPLIEQEYLDEEQMKALKDLEEKNKHD